MAKAAKPIVEPYSRKCGCTLRIVAQTKRKIPLEN
jgi:hypothetical protein